MPRASSVSWAPAPGGLAVHHDQSQWARQQTTHFETCWITVHRRTDAGGGRGHGLQLHVAQCRVVVVGRREQADTIHRRRIVVKMRMINDSWRIELRLWWRVHGARRVHDMRRVLQCVVRRGGEGRVCSMMLGRVRRVGWWWTRQRPQVIWWGAGDEGQ